MVRWWLDLMIFKVFSNLSNSMILWFYDYKRPNDQGGACAQRIQATGTNLHKWRALHSCCSWNDPVTSSSSPSPNHSEFINNLHNNFDFSLSCSFSTCFIWTRSDSLVSSWEEFSRSEWSSPGGVDYCKGNYFIFAHKLERIFPPGQLLWTPSWIKLCYMSQGLGEFLKPCSEERHFSVPVRSCNFSF